MLSDFMLLALIMGLGSLVLLVIAAFSRPNPPSPHSPKIDTPAKVTPRRNPRRAHLRALRPRPGPWILIDGSNVLHWRDGQPEMATVHLVVQELTQRGFSPGVMFDANVGYKIGDRYQDDAELARQLGLPADRVLVVPKGTPADTYLLQAARNLNARVVTNDRFRDWTEAHPEVLTPGFLIRGGFGKSGLWFDAALTQAAAVH
jgi:hypothetical protein